MSTAVVLAMIALSFACIVALGITAYVYYNKSGSSGGGGSSSGGGGSSSSGGSSSKGGSGGGSGGGGSGGGGGGGGSSGGSRVFAPYVMLSPSTVRSIKGKWTTLAFVIGYSNGKITWDAGSPSASSIKERAVAAKRKGGGVIVSFGGQSAGEKGKKGFAELAGQFHDASQLATAYAKVADALGSTWLDFDVEGKAVTDAASVSVRAKALKILQDRRKDIKVQFTVPVGLDGLEASTKKLLSAVKSHGVKIDYVNIMTMYFTTKKTDMGKACMKAAGAARSFVDSLGARMGVTPQIGKNPDKPYTAENFTVADAKYLAATAKSAGYIGLLAFWELGKDSKGTNEAQGAKAEKTCHKEKLCTNPWGHSGACNNNSLAAVHPEPVEPVPVESEEPTLTAAAALKLPRDFRTAVGNSNPNSIVISQTSWERVFGEVHNLTFVIKAQDGTYVSAVAKMHPKDSSSKSKGLRMPTALVLLIMSTLDITDEDDATLDLIKASPGSPGPHLKFSARPGTDDTCLVARHVSSAPKAAAPKAAALKTTTSGGVRKSAAPPRPPPLPPFNRNFREGVKRACVQAFILRELHAVNETLDPAFRVDEARVKAELEDVDWGDADYEDLHTLRELAVQAVLDSASPDQ